MAYRGARERWQVTISLEDRAEILSSVRIGCTLAKSAKGMGTTERACRELAATDAGWAADLADAQRERAAPAAADVAPAPTVEVKPTWPELFAMSAAQQAADAAETKPRRDLAAWAKASTREEAAAAAAPSRARSTVLDPHSADPAEEGEAWGKFRIESARDYGPGRWGLYLLQDKRLIAGGLPASSAWWLKTFYEFFESDLTWLLAMVGRGAGKSTNLERLMLIIVLFTKRIVPRGQTWESPFMSVLERDALRRLGEIQALLLIAHHIEVAIKSQRIKVPDSSGNTIDIVSTAGTIGQTSGPTTVTAFFDEAAKGHTAHGAANLDSELIASIVGTSREVVGWTGVRCSSAFETRGAHFLNCMEGTNSENYVATIGADFIEAALAGYEDVARWESAQGNSHGAAQIRAFAKTLHPGSPNVATWVARPTLTALKSRMKLETLPKDDPALEGLSRFDYWIREYGSMPLSRERGADYTEQCMLAANMTARLTGKRPVPRGEEAGLIKVAGAPPGDARYAGPPPRERAKPVGDWRGRKVF